MKFEIFHHADEISVAHMPYTQMHERQDQLWAIGPMSYSVFVPHSLCWKGIAF